MAALTKIKATLASLALVGSLTIGSVKAQPISGNIELLLSPSKAITDTKLSVPAAGNFSFFLRNRLTTDYRKLVGDFSLLDVQYNFNKNVAVYFETQYTRATGVTPYIGGIYNNQFGNVFLMISPLMSLDGKNGIVQTITSYTPRIGNNTKLVAQLETFIGTYNCDYSWSIERLRLGVSKRGYQLGIALDANQAKGVKPDYVLGVYLKKIL